MYTTTPGNLTGNAKTSKAAHLFLAELQQRGADIEAFLGAAVSPKGLSDATAWFEDPSPHDKAYPKGAFNNGRRMFAGFWASTHGEVDTPTSLEARRIEVPVVKVVEKVVAVVVTPPATSSDLSPSLVDSPAASPGSSTLVVPPAASSNSAPFDLGIDGVGDDGMVTGMGRVG